MNDDFRRRLLDRQLQAAGKSANASPAKEEAKPEDPDRLVSEETEARLRAAKASAERLAKTGAALTGQATRAAVEKTRGITVRRSHLVAGAVVLALAGGGWWWMQHEPAPAVPAKTQAPATEAAPVENTAITPASVTEPVAAPAMPMMAAPGRFDPAAVQEQARLEREQEAAGRAQAEAEQLRQEEAAREAAEQQAREQEAAKAAEAQRAREEVERRKAQAAVRPAPAKPRAVVREPVPAPVKADPQVDEQLRQLDDWGKRLEQQQ